MDKREQDRAVRLAGRDGDQETIQEEAKGGAFSSADDGKAKKLLRCNTCGLTFPDTVRRW